VVECGPCPVFASFTSLAGLKAWYHVTRRARFYGYAMSRVTIKRTEVFIWSARNFCPILTKYWFFSTDFRKISQYKTSRKYFQCEPP
jgi:hypothetical protein